MEVLSAPVDPSRGSPSLSDLLDEPRNFGHGLGTLEEVKIQDHWQDFLDVAAHGHISAKNAEQVRYVSKLSTVESYPLTWILKQLRQRVLTEINVNDVADLPLCQVLQGLSSMTEKKSVGGYDPKIQTLLHKNLALMKRIAVGSVVPIKSVMKISPRFTQQASFISYVQSLALSLSDYEYYATFREVERSFEASGEVCDDFSERLHYDKDRYFKGRMIDLYDIQDDIRAFLDGREPLKITKEELNSIFDNEAGYKERYQKALDDPQVITEEDIRDLSAVLTRISHKINSVERSFATVRSVPVLWRNYLADKKLKKELARVEADRAIALQNQMLASQLMNLQNFKQRELAKDIEAKIDEQAHLSKQLDAAVSQSGLSVKFEKSEQRKVDDIVCMRKTCIYVLKLIFTLGLLAIAVGRDIRRCRANVVSARLSIQKSRNRIRRLRADMDKRNAEKEALSDELQRLKDGSPALSEYVSDDGSSTDSESEH
jgi:hypothetical protein